MSRNKKAFTLIELMVAMGVVAVLIGLSVFGIQTVLRNQRNTERLKFASDLQLSATDFYNVRRAYPTFTRSGGNVLVRDTSNATFATIPVPVVVSAEYELCYVEPSTITIEIERPDGTEGYPDGGTCEGATF